MQGDADSEDRAPGAEPAGGSRGARAGPRVLPDDAAGRAGIAAAGVLAVVAFRELLWFQSERSLPAEIEEWFFIPSDTIAPAVVVMSLWLLFRRWRRLAALPPAVGVPRAAAGLLAAGFASYLWATYTSAVDLLAPALALLSLGLATLWKGPAAIRCVWLPAAVLVFAMPLPGPLLNELVFRLQIWTADLSGWLLAALGVPHLVTGDQIVRVRETFSVIESCSGLRSMETLTMVAILMVDLFRRRGLHAVVVVAAAVPLAFLLNAGRVVTVVVNPHSQIAAIHNLQGVAILLTGLLILFGLDGLLERLVPTRPPVRAAPKGRPALAPAAGAGRPHIAAAATLLGACALASVWLPVWEPPKLEPLRLGQRIDREVGDLIARKTEINRLYLGSARFQDTLSRRFERVGGRVDLFIGVGDRKQRPHSALSPKTALPGSGWIVEEEGEVELEPGGRVARSRLLRSGSRRRLTYHWFEGNGPWLAEMLRSLLAVDRSPGRRRQEIVAVRIGIEVVGLSASGRAHANSELMSFYRELRTLLDRLDEPRLGKVFPDFPVLGKDLPPARIPRRT